MLFDPTKTSCGQAADVHVRPRNKCMEMSKLVNEPQSLNPEAHKAVRLVDYLLRLATLRAKLIRDINVMSTKELLTKLAFFGMRPFRQVAKLNREVWRN
jgi:hypothetical protein